MAYQGNTIISLKAAENLEAKRFVSMTTNGLVLATSSNADKIVGITKDGVKSGEVAPVIISGVAEVECEATINVGDVIKVNANGKANTIGTEINAICVGTIDATKIEVLL